MILQIICGLLMFQVVWCGECTLNSLNWYKCDCQFGDWSAFIPCTKQCNGYTYRTRSMWLYENYAPCPFEFTTCATEECGYEVYYCNTDKCQNGGTSDNKNCFCPTGYYGSCCEQVPPGKPVITVPDTIVLGNAVTLTCTSNGGNPEPTVKWFKDGAEITTGVSYKTVSPSTNSYTVTSTLNFVASLEHHLKVITCQADNGLTSPLSTTEQLIVNFAPEAPTLDGPTVVTSGVSRVWTCHSANGYPAGVMTMRNQNTNTQFGTDKFSTSTVDNEGGKSYTVTGRLNWAPVEANNGHSICCDVLHTTTLGNTPKTKCLQLSVKPPLVLNAPTIQYKVHLNAKVTLSCEVTSGKLSQITWLKDGSKLDIDSNPRLSGGTVAAPSLVITDVELSDEAGYVCQGTDSTDKVTIATTDSIKVALICIEPAPVPNAELTVSGFDPSNTATYRCNDCYEKTSGDLVLNCMRGGIWSGVIPVCTEINHCLSQPCIFGTCTSELCGYKCACLTGYKGTNCDQEVSCPVVALQNGAIMAGDKLDTELTQDHVLYNMDISYGCDDGYVLVDQKGGFLTELVRHCGETGQLTGDAPICAVYNLCATTTPCVHGTCKDLPGNYHCTCSIGYKGQNCDQDIICAELTLHNGAVMYKPDRKIGSVATYSCNQGYNLANGDLSSTCNSEGEWSGPLPTCKGVSCPYHTLENGKVTTTGLTFGHTATYTCSSGYMVANGDVSRTCASDEYWLGKMPVCADFGLCSSSPCKNGGTCTDLPGGYSCACAEGWKGKTCEEIKSCKTELWDYCGCSLGEWKEWVDCSESCNGYTYRLRSIWLYQNKAGCPFVFETCAPTECGYELDFCNTDSCQNGGLTTYQQCLCTGGHTGQCCDEAVTCPDPTPANGFVSDSLTDYGSCVDFWCDEGYKLDGSSHSCCHADGKWSGERQCVGIVCPAFDVVNGAISVTDGVNYGSTATVSCNTGFILNGNSSATCGGGGIWSAPKPQCERIVCPAFDVVNGAISVTDGVNYGSTATISCNTGYNLNGASTATCGDGGVWSATKPVCEIVTCPKHTIDHGTVTGTAATYGHDISYKCDEGFQLVGDHIRKCGADGLWTGVEATCQDIDECATKPCQNGAQCNDQINAYTCTCADGFAGVHCEENINECAPAPCKNGATCNDQVNGFTCTCDGGYTGTLCEAEIPCNKLDVVPHVTVLTSGVEVGESVTYACEHGYQLTAGNLLRTCQLAPSWSGIPPVCSMIPCADPTTILNGQFTTLDSPVMPGSQVTYTCDIGYQLENGHSTMNCDVGGLYSGALPVCTDIDYCIGVSCKNGGTCRDQLTDFVCDCTGNYYGKLCQNLDGGWTDYSDWSVCSTTCGEGIQIATRTCTNPQPEDGGLDCIGDEKSTKECKLAECTLPPKTDEDFCVGKVSGFYAHPTDCAAYYVCHDDTERTALEYCGVGTYWSQSFKVCADPTITEIECFGGVGTYGSEDTTESECWTNSIHTENVYKYQLLSDHGITVTIPNLIKFKVKANNDAHLALLSSANENDPLYEIVIGGWGNTKSVIRDKKQGDPKATHLGEVLNPNEYQTFYVTWKDGNIRVEDENNVKLMEWTDTTNPLRITNVGISTGFGASGDWQFPYACQDCSTIQNGYLPDPDDCSSFIQCANGVSYPQKCPTGLQWRNSLLVCDLPQNVGCTIEPVDGGWTDWSDWSACSVSCGQGGTKSKSRTCTNPAKKGAGADCIGENIETVACEGYLCQAGKCVIQACASWQYSKKECTVTGMIADSMIYSMEPDNLPVWMKYLCSAEHYGFTPRQGIWVTQGCRADFSVCFIEEYNDCTSSPCQNGGTCNDGEASYTCTCPGPYEGTNCENKVPCSTPGDVLHASKTVAGLAVGQTVKYQCEFGYALTTGDSVLTCALGPRWEGTMPSCKIIECTVSGYNEFTIPSVTDTIVPTTEVSFKCKPGYQLPVGDTGTRTCQKGGTMSASPPACEDINECLSTPCQNGATCHNEVNAYSCTCVPGYQGTNCESEIPCTTPGSVLHASATVSGLAVGQTVTYTCDFGYVHTNGDSVLTCEVGPSWRGIIPVCSIMKCSAPGINEFTITSTNTDVVPSTEVTYTCEFGYQLPAGDLGTRRCQLGGTWPAPPPACEVMKCSAPGINEFTITSTNTDVVPSTEVTYTCKFGYQLPAGDLGTRTCQLGGTWPAPPPACEVTKCSAPGINEFTITSTNTDVVPSTEVTYTCEFGYQLPAGDSGTRICQLGGTWPAPQPACEVTKCTAPGINEFTITSTNTDVVPSTEVTYTCEFGYQLPAGDLGSRICQLGGTWPAPPPACEVTKCTAPGINEFTITSTNTDVVPSTEVTYTCEFGYQLPAGDLGTRVCQLGGKWPAPPPACEVTKCTAPGINEFTITSTNTDVVPSTEVTYTCEFGYQLPAGDLGTRICQLGGTWPAPPPACEVTKCTAPGINEFTITSTNTDVVPSTEVTYTCEFGYQLPAGDLGTRICQLGGTWPAPPPACEVMKCSAPGINEFTITSTNTDVVPSTEVTYTCEFGYQLPAGDLGTRICQLGGAWPAPPPACEVTKCSAPGINEFTITSTNTDVVPSTEVTYTCEFGYQLPAGDLGTRICQLGGTWPAPPPACEVTKCTAPGINEFTITSTNTDVVPSTEVTYTCEFGYQLPAGDLGTRICQLGGTWPTPPPACEVIKCEAPGLNEFTITSTNTDVVPSTEVTYTCEFGYQLPAGDLGTRICQLGGTWPAPPPACEVIKCKAPGINEFTITSTNTDVVPSTEVTYTCEFGYQLPAGDLGTRRCQLGGTWPAPPPACEVIKCKAPGINEFTITSTNTDVVPSTEVTYTCEFGYQLPAGDLGTRRCQLGGTWPAPPPACEVIKCTAPGINEFTITSTNTDVVPSTEVTYTCEFGYQLPAGDLGTRRCQLGGTWPALPPACAVMKCTAPGLNEFTITSTNTDVVPSTEVTYTCEFGYQLPAGDLGTRICQLGGTWPAPPPACEVVKCTAPGINEFTITSTNTDVVPSTEVTYTCEFGYQLPAGDLGTRICQLGGTWPAPPPACEVIKCTAPGINQFTVTSTNTDVVPSTEVTYTCEFGYQLPTGDLGTRICQLGGTWPALPPACEVMKCTAPGINEFTIASTNTDVVPSTEVTYTCEFGYQLPAGDLGTRICQLGGTWPAPPPACEVIKCAAPGINEFTITSAHTDVVPSTEVTYTCEFGYQLPAGDLGTRICQLGGTWPAPPPACEVVKCTAPGINEFTITSTNTDVVPSTEVTYTCEFGYQLPAGDLGTRICQLGGTWPAPPPACEVIKCTAPGINQFTVTSTNTDVVPSTEVTYTCEFGYQLPAGDLGTRICQLGGTWPALPPACEVMKCTAPGINEFTIASTNTDVVPSTEVTYTCEFGYQLPAGDLGTRICQLGGTWPAPPPACEVIKCAAPGINEFTITSAHTDVVPSTEVTYTCEFGYQLPAGDLGTRICQLGGTWPAPPPACEVIKCTAPGINEFTITSTNTDVVPSTEVTYTCEFGYQLPAGDLGTRICQLGGIWPAPPPACEVMNCTAPGINEFTITSTYTDVVPSTEVTYTCEFGYQLPAGELGTRICQLGGTWPAPPPACEVIKCDISGYNQFTIPSSTDTVVPETEVSYTCLPGYQLPTGDLGTRICQLGGTWPTPPPACEDIDECLTTPCQNGATCHNEVNAYSCTCMPGYEGTNCEINIDECATAVCQNGATCNDLVNGYTCSCATGYTDTHCETEIPCEDPQTITHASATITGLEVGDTVEYECNFGYLLNGNSLLTCVVGPSWDGTLPTCSIIECVKPSAPAHTSTGGSGKLGGFGFNTNTNSVPGQSITYTCNAGYELTGGDLTRNCELGGGWDGQEPVCTEIDECEGIVCENGGTCVDGFLSYSCECIEHFEGTHCETNTDNCVGNDCENGATCVDGLSSYTCNCAEDFEGDFCETRIDDCENNPCLNGATCVDGINSYTCTCPDSHTGEHCEIDIDFCDGVNCLNGGSCQDGLLTFTCNCDQSTAYYGQFCQNLDGAWGEWTDWSPCSATCGDGIETSTRTCTSPPPEGEGSICQGEGAKTQACNLMDCKWPSNANTEFCTSKAAGSYANPEDCTSYYICRDDFTGALLEYCMEGENWDDTSKRCDSNAPCASEDVGDADVDGGWSDWSAGPCSESCGTGTKVLTRTCTNPTPQNNGADCVGEGSKTEPCERSLCQAGGCQEVRCESWQYDQENCNVTGMVPDSLIYSMEIIKRLTGAPCVKNETFGYNERKDIWVDSGCQGDFQVCFIREYDDCSPAPCLNGGTCTDGIADYECTCASGFYGDNCEQVRNSCYGVDCNGGTCVVDSQDATQYTCQCADGATGDHCEDMDTGGMQSAASNVQISLFGTFLAVTMAMIWNII